MHIWLLGPSRPELEAWMVDQGDTLRRLEEPLPDPSMPAERPDLMVSYGYRHRVSAAWIAVLPWRIVNLHISYLPWNRGADPNLWSVLEGSPTGVSIHFVDAGLDTGDLIAQRQVAVLANDTLATSYARLSRALEDLFRDVWPDLRAGRALGHPQPDGGSVHRLRDRERVAHLLALGWDTPVAGLREAYINTLER